MLVTDGGQLIRCPVHDIRIAGRNTQGVRIFKTDVRKKSSPSSASPTITERTRLWSRRRRSNRRLR